MYNFKIINCTSIFIFIFINPIFSQIDFSKKDNDEKFIGHLLKTQKQDDYLIETKILENDTITFMYDNNNIAKLISLKNKTVGITNKQFHKKATEINLKFRFSSKIETDTSILFFNQEKNLMNVKVFENKSKTKLIEIYFTSDKRLIENILSKY